MPQKFKISNINHAPKFFLKKIKIKPKGTKKKQQKRSKILN